MSTIALLVFPLLMAFAASSDLLTMRISNYLVLMLVAAFFIIALIAGISWSDIVTHVGVALAVLTVTFSFFAFGWIGGGDAKLAAATSLWLGSATLLPYIVYAGLLGGALTLAILLLRRWPLNPLIARITWIGRLHDRKAGVPYGIALAAAGLLVYSDTAIYQYFVA